MSAILELSTELNFGMAAWNGTYVKNWKERETEKYWSTCFRLLLVHLLYICTFIYMVYPSPWPISHPSRGQFLWAPWPLPWPSPAMIIP